MTLDEVEKEKIFLKVSNTETRKLFFKANDLLLNLDEKHREFLHT